MITETIQTDLVSFQSLVDLGHRQFCFEARNRKTTCIFEIGSSPRTVFGAEVALYLRYGARIR